MNRRITDRCIAKRLWENFTPYVQIAGFILTIGGGAIACGMFWGAVQDALADVKDIKEWKAQTSVNLAVMQQEIHDIHEQLVPRKR